ncbi:MAG: hypothetical protein ABEJ30_06520 [Halorientalis sp.]
MDLSSCYFCGTALDAPVSEYALGPDAPAVSLCPTCRRKLAAVVEAVDAEGAAAALGDADVEPDAAAERGARSPVADVDQEESRGGAAASGDDGEEDGPDADAESDAETGTAPDADTDSGPVDDAAGTDPEDWFDGDEGRNGTGAEAGDPGGAAGTGGDEPASGGEERSADDGGAAVLESAAAKKVIRLLQNREFPVEREEFAVVAANAYDLDRRECQDVIDALVAEGYLGERDDQLVRSE